MSAYFAHKLQVERIDSHHHRAVYRHSRNHHNKRVLTTYDSNFYFVFVKQKIVDTDNFVQFSEHGSEVCHSLDTLVSSSLKIYIAY